MTVARVGVGGNQFAHARTIFALGDVACRKGNARRRVVLRWLRLRRGVVRVVLNAQGKGFLRGESARVGGGDGQVDGFFARVVEMLPRFELQRAIGGDFKAVVADFISVRVARVGVGRGQFAYGRAVLALGDLAFRKGNIRRRVILRRLRLRRWVIRVVLHLQGERFLRGQPTRVGRGDGKVDGFFRRVVEMLSRFQL